MTHKLMGDAQMKYPDKESGTLEFKRELPQNDQVVKTVIGFCNHSGGQLLVGIADDGTVVGLEESAVETAIENLERAIFDASSPSIIPRVFARSIGEKRIIVIEVSEGMSKPYFRRSEGVAKGTYIRLGKRTVRATPEMIRELEWQARGISVECIPVYRASQDDLDLAAFQQFLDNRINQAKAVVSEQMLRAYDVITFEHGKTFPTILGLLMFGQDPQRYLSEAMIICTHFRGVSGRDVIATVDCVGTLFNQMKTAFAFVAGRLSRSFEITGLKRDEMLEVPEVAIREALLNVLVHRNYHITGPSKVAIYDDRIEIFSPGQFSGPLNSNDLLQGISYLRNPMICKIMREAGFIEKLGTGFIQIFESYGERNLQPPSVIEGENFIKCVLPRVQKEQRLGTAVVHQVDELERLFMSHHEMSISDVVRQLSISRSTALRRLNALISDGVIEKMGVKKSVRYRRK